MAIKKKKSKSKKKPAKKPARHKTSKKHAKHAVRHRKHVKSSGKIAAKSGSTVPARTASSARTTFASEEQEGPERIKLLIERSDLERRRGSSETSIVQPEYEQETQKSFTEKQSGVQDKPEHWCGHLNISILKLVISGVVFAAIAQIIHSIGAVASMGYYLMEEYFPVWSIIMMPSAGAPHVEFYYYSIGFSFITGILFAFVFAMFACCLGGGDRIKRGIYFGLGVFLVAGLPGAFSMYLLLNLPVGLLAIWAFENLLISVMGGVAVAHIIKENQL